MDWKASLLLQQVDMKFFLPAILIFLLGIHWSCENKSSQGDWIKGTEEEKLMTVEKHFRGLDVAMVEIGYRYQELYWAGQDANWEYALYQLDKIKLSLANAIVRRPLRNESGSYFLENDLPLVYAAVNNQDTAVFNDAFQIFTVSCNNCHAKEKVPFFTVHVPTVRNSVIHN
jgi:hypothetical protein